MADVSLSAWMRALIAYVRSGEPDLTNRQMALLLLVYLTPGPHTVRGLAKVLGVSKPVVTRALNTLGALGYLRRERDQDDRRNVFVVRTNNGADFLEGFKRNLRDGDGATIAHRPIIGQAAYAHQRCGFFTEWTVCVAGPGDARLSPGLGRRRARRTGDCVALCGAGAAGFDPRYSSTRRRVRGFGSACATARGSTLPASRMSARSLR